MPVHRVSLAFAKFADPNLFEFANGIVIAMTDNPAFPAPPVSMADLARVNKDFETALTAAFGGGIQLTAVKNAARVALIAALRDEATYVQMRARNDLPTLLTSGFSATSKNAAQSPLPKPVIFKIVNECSGELVVRAARVPNTNSYQVRRHNGDGVWEEGGVFRRAGGWC